MGRRENLTAYLPDPVARLRSRRGEAPDTCEVMRSVNRSEMLQLLFVDSPAPEGRRRMSALMRITDSSRTSRHVREVPRH